MLVELPYRTRDPHVSYVLPATVQTQIPLHHKPRQRMVLERARGILVELCRLLRAEPVSLEYSAHMEPAAGACQLSVIIAVVGFPRYRRLKIVYSFRHVRHCRISWQLTVNDQLIAYDVDRLPSNCDIAVYVARHLRLV